MTCIYISETVDRLYRYLPATSRLIWFACSCVECTSAALQALTEFKQLHPQHRRKEVEICIEKGAKFIENIQEADGSWSAFPFLFITFSYFLHHDFYMASYTELFIIMVRVLIMIDTLLQVWELGSLLHLWNMVRSKRTRGSWTKLWK